MLRKGSDDEGMWLRWEVARKGRGDEGMVMKGSGDEGSGD